MAPHSRRSRNLQGPLLRRKRKVTAVGDTSERVPIPDSRTATHTAIIRSPYRLLLSDAPLPKIIDGKVLSPRAAVLMYARAIMLVAGGGESRMFVGHDHSDGDRNDIRAAEFCACWVSSDPSVFEDGPRRCWQLHERKHQVEALAAALLQEGSLDAAEIAAILSGRPDVTRRSRWNASIVNAESFSRTFGTLTRNPIPM